MPKETLRSLHIKEPKTRDPQWMNGIKEALWNKHLTSTEKEHVRIVVQ